MHERFVILRTEELYILTFLFKGENEHLNNNARIQKNTRNAQKIN